MRLYVVYDAETGDIVHTHASYVLGNDDPVAADEDEVLALASTGARQTRALKVAVAPPEFDIRSRLDALRIDPETSEVRVVRRERPGPGREAS